MSPSLEQLLSIVRNYWPSNEDHYLRGEASPENERLDALWNQELKKMDRWWALLHDLEGALPEFTIGDATATINASFRCVAYSGKKAPHRFAVVGCASILAPVFAVYGLEFSETEETRTVSRTCFDPLPAHMQGPAGLIARKLEANFGFDELPRELADTPVPLFVEWKKPPDTTLFHALFASVPESVP
ncbi:hypothetical protein F0U61_11775 [Archangium violaceum]|uniref:hypothetical protein n=1 Tax=Archangium violaceum TaxID=83451 RepID=UPI002B325F69|nr:hypothetical protein F0U61_11775 [Archangium violaceum]